MSNSFRPLLDAEWPKIQPRGHLFSLKPPEVIWKYCVSPPPPPNGHPRHYYYVYASAYNPLTLADGAYIAAPWGCVGVKGKGNVLPKFIRLTGTLVEIGIQGVRPIQ